MRADSVVKKSLGGLAVIEFVLLVGSGVAILTSNQHHRKQIATYAELNRNHRAEIERLAHERKEFDTIAKALSKTDDEHLNSQTSFPDSYSRKDIGRKRDSGISSDRMSWRRKYFRPVKEGTYNIIVMSLRLDQDIEDANSALKEFEARFPSVAFRIMSSVAADRVSNKRYAIVVGQGVTLPEAENLVKEAKALGIAPKTYMTYQLWDVD